MLYYGQRINTDVTLNNKGIFPKPVAGDARG
jgi:hypothetical protein